VNGAGWDRIEGRMTLRRQRVGFGFSALIMACGGGGTGASPDGAISSDAGGTHLEGGPARQDGGTPGGDGSSPRPDGGSPGTEASTTDAHVATGDAGVCTPAPGSATFTGYCGALQLAVLQHTGGATTLMLSGSLEPGVASQSPCTVVDSVEILSGNTDGSPLQHMTGVTPTSENTQLGILAVGTSPVADITNRCSSNDPSDRIDTYGITITGHTDGGTFTAACGAIAGEGSWPPPLTVTCHSNIDSPPLGGNISIMSSTSMGITFTQTMIYTSLPNVAGATLSSVDSAMFVIPAMSPFNSGMPIAPFNTTGWMGSVTQQPYGTIPSSQIGLFATDNPFPSGACLPASMGLPEAGAPLPPIIIGRITGTGSAGAFSTEAYLGGCVTEDIMGP
jgi:hypothetical protein